MGLLEMIQTGPRIEQHVANSKIVIDPFDRRCLNPNSYNYHLGPLVHRLNDGQVAETHDLRSAPLVLEPRTVYLGHTLERIGSEVYVTLLNGRSSLGRLGLFLNYSADLGHRGAVHCWTLELLAAHPIWIYFGMEVGQATFWSVAGAGPIYCGRFAQFDGPTPGLQSDLEWLG